MGGKTSTEAKNRWIRKNYDRINLALPAGSREYLRALASDAELSVNKYIQQLIYQDAVRRSASSAGAADAADFFSDCFMSDDVIERWRAAGVDISLCLATSPLDDV